MTLSALLSLKSEICYVKKFRADIIFSNNSMILLQTSKTNQFFLTYIIYKELRKREINAVLHWFVESLYGFFEILPELILIQMKKLGEVHFQRLLRVFKRLLLHLPISQKPFSPYISYMLLLFLFCI